MKSTVLVALGGAIGAVFGSSASWWSILLFVGVGVASLVWAAHDDQKLARPRFRPERCNVVPVRVYDWQRQVLNNLDRQFSPTSVHGSVRPTRAEPQAVGKAVGRGGTS